MSRTIPYGQIKKYYKKIKIKGKWIKTHRYIMEQHLGRKLNMTEAVHHINGDIHDNRIENLKLMSIEKHISISHAGKKHNYPKNCKRNRKETRKLK